MTCEQVAEIVERLMASDDMGWNTTIAERQAVRKHWYNCPICEALIVEKTREAFDLIRHDHEAMTRVIRSAVERIALDRADPESRV